MSTTSTCIFSDLLRMKFYSPELINESMIRDKGNKNENMPFKVKISHRF